MQIGHVQSVHQKRPAVCSFYNFTCDRPPEPRVHARREQRPHRITRRFDPGSRDEFVVQFEDLGRPQRPRAVLVGHPPRPSGLAGVRAPPGGQPDLELGRLHLRADADRQPAAQSPSRQSASALVADLVGGSGDTHLSPCVRDAHRGAHDGHHRKARGLKRAEQHAAPSGRIDRVQPHIGLVEGAEVRQRHCGAHRGMPHRERDQAHVGNDRRRRRARCPAGRDVRRPPGAPASARRSGRPRTGRTSPDAEGPAR